MGTYAAFYCGVIGSKDVKERLFSGDCLEYSELCIGEIKLLHRQMHRSTQSLFCTDTSRIRASEDQNAHILNSQM